MPGDTEDTSSASGIVPSLSCPCCCCAECGCTPMSDNASFVVAVLNANGVGDDDFELYLNGNLIATLVESIPTCFIDSCRGHIIGSATPTDLPEIGCIGPLYTLETHGDLDNITDCELVFELRSIQSNGCGNWGKFMVWCLLNTGQVGKILLNTYYSMSPLSSNMFVVANPCCG